MFSPRLYVMFWLSWQHLLKEQKLLISVKSSLSVFFLISCVFGVIKEIIPQPKITKIYFFLLLRFIFLALIFSSVLYFELVFVYDIRQGLKSSFMHVVYPVVTEPFAKKTILIILSWPLWRKSTDHKYWSSFLDSILLHWSIVVVQLLSFVRLVETPWTAAQQATLSSTISRSLFKFMSNESVMLSSHLILCHPLLLLPSIFPSSRVFSNESALCLRWPKYYK